MIKDINSRTGTLSSSNIWKLTKTDRSGKNFGEKALTYIKQVKYEIRSELPIKKEFNAKPTNWGKFIERRVFDMIGKEYQLVSQDRLFHKELPYWSGATDSVKILTTVDIKCPWDRETFFDKLDALERGLEAYKAEYPEDYWQHVSNACLLESNGIPITHFEPIIYMPYESELEEIKESVNQMDGDTTPYAFIFFGDKDELPYIKDNGYYKNLNIFNFEIPKADKDELLRLVKEAGKILLA
jgi:hypothetical protein